MPKVYNKHKPPYPPDAVYIGRGTEWGNPYRITPTLSRGWACDLYEDYVDATPGMRERIQSELKGKDLLCSCTPQRCHGDYLLKVANS